MKATKPHNSGTWTKSRYMQQIRSHLRNAFRYWRPIIEAKNKARSPNNMGLTTDKGNLLKWKFECSHCKKFFGEKQVQVDHIIPCGSIKELADIPIFIQKLTAEGGYQVLCKDCHKKVTAYERQMPIMASYWQERIEYYQEAIGRCERELRELNNKGEIT